MYPFKRKTASDGSTSPELTEEEKQRRKKFVIYPLMFLLFAGPQISDEILSWESLGE